MSTHENYTPTVTIHISYMRTGAIVRNAHSLGTARLCMVFRQAIQAQAVTASLGQKRQCWPSQLSGSEFAVKLRSAHDLAAVPIPKPEGANITADPVVPQRRILRSPPGEQRDEAATVAVRANSASTISRSEREVTGPLYGRGRQRNVAGRIALSNTRCGSGKRRRRTRSSGLIIPSAAKDCLLANITGGLSLAQASDVTCDSAITSRSAPRNIGNCLAAAGIYVHKVFCSSLE